MPRGSPRVLVKCEPDRRGKIRGHRHTMLDDTDINAQRHIRGAVAGLVAGVIGDGRIFVSGGAEHQGPDGGGLIAVIASQDKGWRLMRIVIVGAGVAGCVMARRLRSSRASR